MTEFFKQAFYGNTLLEWAIALGVIVLSVLLGKVVYWLFSKVVRAFTDRTKSKIDDLVVDMIEEPVVFTIIVTGIWFGLNLLKLPQGLETTIDNAYQIIFALLLGWMITRLFQAVYEEYLLPWADKTENDLDDQLLPILSKGVKMMIWVLAALIGLNNAGYDINALIAGLGIGGLALAMAAKDTVSNIFGGFTIFTDQPFRLNDRIKISGYDGTVSEIGVRSTRLKTLEGRTVTIPNSKFADAPVENVSREPSRKVIVELGMTYDTNAEQMEQAMQLLRDIVNEHGGTEESVTVMFSGFGDFALTLKLIYYISKGADIAGTQTEINLAILRRFADEKLEFAFPTQTIYNVSG